MKLNNKGWGTMEMLILSGCLLVALLVAIFFISRLYASFGKNMTNNYLNLETKLVDAGKKYVKDNKIEIDDTFKISSEILILDGYINDLKDNNNELCTGYVKINNINNHLDYQGYIKCNNYQTNNYNE